MKTNKTNIRIFTFKVKEVGGKNGQHRIKEQNK